MNIAEHSEHMTRLIEARATEFILDNVSKGLTIHHVPLIEAAMLIGASVALGLNAPAIDPDCECPGCGCVHSPNESCPDSEPDPDDGMTDVEADADTLRCAGMGTDEDYWHGDSDGSVGCD